jgi:hypothetical protein
MPSNQAFRLYARKLGAVALALCISGIWHFPSGVYLVYVERCVTPSPKKRVNPNNSVARCLYPFISCCAQFIDAPSYACFHFGEFNVKD